MKKLLLSITILLAASLGATAQHNGHAGCGTDAVLAEQIRNNPDLKLRMQQFNQLVQQQLSAKGKANSDSDIDQEIVIPVVFHVFHVNGPENISRAQILDQIRILNADYSRTNTDTANTDSIFKPVAANMHIRFELAKTDPNGKCTDGVVRVYSTYTTNADDAIKSLSVWPNQRYLNVWVVKSIRDRGQGGTILGYAQFPWMTDPRIFQSNITDGVIIRSDYIGSIGTSDAAKAGRVATHEIGHWLGLFHPFQDGCDGGDQVGDTPPVKDANFGCVPRNSCEGDNPDLPDMIQNFMDYADGNCQNLFTLGQKDRVRYVLFNNRMDLWSPANLYVTGITSPQAQSCLPVPVAAFNCSNRLPCATASVTFRDASYNGTVASRNWEFPGGTPATSTQATPSVQYAAPGKYNVKLSVTNANGTDTSEYLEYIEVLPASPPVQMPFAENMENLYLSPGSWYAEGTSPEKWKLNNAANYTGKLSLSLKNNFAQNGNTHILYAPPFTTNGVTSPMLTFAYSYAQKSGSLVGVLSPTNDRFTVAVSFDCGNTWNNVWSKQGNALNTLNGAIVPENNFVPSGRDMWKVISLPLSSAGNKANVRVRFEFTSDGGGNIYLDDININSTGTLGTAYMNASTAGCTLHPNPASNVAYLESAHPINEFLITGMDGIRAESCIINRLGEGRAELHTIAMKPGVYAVTIRSGAQTETLKLVVVH